MAVEDVLDDGEAQAGASLLAACRHVDPVEALGQPRQVLRARCPGPSSRHRDDDSAPGRRRRRPRARRPTSMRPPALAVLDGVLHQVLEHLHDLVAVAAHRTAAGIRRELRSSWRRAGSASGCSALDDVRHRFVEVDTFGGRQVLAHFDARRATEGRRSAGSCARPARS